MGNPQNLFFISAKPSFTQTKIREILAIICSILLCTSKEPKHMMLYSFKVETSLGNSDPPICSKCILRDAICTVIYGHGTPAFDKLCHSKYHVIYVLIV